MGWQTPPRETYIKLGEDSGDGRTRSEVAGVLLDIVPEQGDDGYPSTYVLQLQLDDGNIANVRPPSWMGKRVVKASHVGKLVRLTFHGMKLFDSGNEGKDVRYEVFEPANKAEYAVMKEQYPALDTVSMSTKPPLPASDLPF